MENSKISLRVPNEDADWLLKINLMVTQQFGIDFFLGSNIYTANLAGPWLLGTDVYA